MFFVVLCSILAMLFCCVLFDCTSTSLTSFAFFCLNHIGDVSRFNNKVWLVFMYTIFTINVGWHRDRPMTSRLLAFQKLLYCYIVTLGVDVVCLSPWHMTGFECTWLYSLALRKRGIWPTFEAVKGCVLVLVRGCLGRVGRCVLGGCWAVWRRCVFRACEGLLWWVGMYRMGGKGLIRRENAWVGL